MKHRFFEITMGWQKFWFAALLIVLTMTAFNAGLQAAEPDEAEGWEFTIVPYLWALALDGDATVKGQKSDVDMPFSDILSNLNGVLMFDFEMRKGRFGGFVNPLYGRLGADSTVQGLKLDTTMDMFIMDFGIYYRLGPYALSNSSDSGAPAVNIYPYVGGRYTYFDIKLDFTGLPEIKGSEDWADPIVGVRTVWDVTRRWEILAGANIGGFGVGANFSWSGYVIGGYRFGLFGGNDNARFLFGYRALYQDFEDGSGPDLFKYDATMHGPILGLSIAF